MRDALDNPFSPGSDSVPQVWAGRDSQLNDWHRILRPRRVAGLYERGRTILGEAGTGKSVLVGRITDDARSRGDWVTPQLRIPSGADPLKIVAAAMLKLANGAGLSSSRDRAIADLLGRVESVAASGVSLSLRSAEGPEPFTVLTDLLVEIGRAAVRRRDVVVLVHIDEVQNITDDRALSQLLIALGDALAHEEPVTIPGGIDTVRHLPIVIYLTGLPDFEDMAGSRKGATFARRFATTTLSAIDDDAVRAALQEFVLDGWDVADGDGGATKVFMETRAAESIVELCRGEPFLFQLAGQAAWYAGSEPTITRQQVIEGWRGVVPEASSHVERVLARLPERERTFVTTMAELPVGERTLSRIATAAGFAKPTDAGPTSQRLDTVRGIIERGRPYSFRNRAVEALLTSDWPLPD